MDAILQQIADWLKGMLVDGIMNNLSGMFDAVNRQVADVATQVGSTPASFSPGVFNLVRGISESVIIPIAGMFLTFIACYELIQLIIEHNNLANFETWIFFKWIFKTCLYAAIIQNNCKEIDDFNLSMNGINLTKTIEALRKETVLLGKKPKFETKDPYTSDRSTFILLVIMFYYMKSKDPKLRPLYLAKILYELTDEDHYLTTAQLMDILEKEYGIKTHRQTIPADVAALRSFGMEIQEVMSAQKRYNLISREYDVAELKLLIDAVESSKFITKKKSEELVVKLSKMAGQNQAEILKRNISPEGRIKYDNESIYLIIDCINEAINAGKKISFLYFKYDVRKEPKLRNEGKPFIFSPHRLVWNGDFYYMVGVFDNGKRVGTFRLDRIMKRPDILEEDALPFPAGFDFEKHLQTSFRMYGTDYTTVDLICKNDLMDAILDKFGKDVTTYCYDMENFRVEVDVVVSSVFFSWVFGFEGDVVINGPVEVKEKYKEMVLKVVEGL